MASVFWIPRSFTDQKSIDRCIRITVPDHCPVCRVAVKVQGGSPSYESTLDSPCDHFHTYPRVWTMRLVKTPRELILRCKACNLPNEYAEPNQEDGTYVCYNCRN